MRENDKYLFQNQINLRLLREKNAVAKSCVTKMNEYL